MRSRTHGPGNLQASLLAVGQLTGQAVGTVHQVNHLQPVESVVQRIAFSLAIALGVENAGEHVAIDPHMLGHQQVLQYRHFLEQADILKGASQT